MAYLRGGPGHHHLPQGWPQAPSSASGLAPGPITHFRADPRPAGSWALLHRPRGTGLPGRPLPATLGSLPPAPSGESLRMRLLSSPRDPRRTPGGGGEPALLLVRTAITQEAGAAPLVRAGRAGKLKRGSRPPPSPGSSPRRLTTQRMRTPGRGASLVARVRAQAGRGACVLRATCPTAAGLGEGGPQGPPRRRLSGAAGGGCVPPLPRQPPRPAPSRCARPRPVAPPPP